MMLERSDEESGLQNATFIFFFFAAGPELARRNGMGRICPGATVKVEAVSWACMALGGSVVSASSRECGPLFSTGRAMKPPGSTPALTSGRKCGAKT